MFVVISYDIVVDKVRNRVVKVLEDFGGARVQYSVFECYLTRQNAVKLRARLEKEIDLEQDSVRFYELCEGCQARRHYLGVAREIEAPGLRIV